MKVKVISRSTDEFTRERSQDLQVCSILFTCLLRAPLLLHELRLSLEFECCQRVFRNFDPNLRTQEKATEYVRALNAAKLEKVIAP